MQIAASERLAVRERAGVEHVVRGFGHRGATLLYDCGLHHFQRRRFRESSPPPLVDSAGSTAVTPRRHFLSVTQANAGVFSFQVVSLLYTGTVVRHGTWHTWVGFHNCDLRELHPII